MRLGVIGIRGQAALWARAASEAPGWSVGACYHPRRARCLTDSPHRQTDDLDELLSSSDAVVISSPTDTHGDYLRTLARRYRGPILVEKPLAGSLEECRRLAGSLPRSFLNRVTVTHNWRFHPWIGEAKRLLSGAGARPVAADFQFTHDFAYKPGYRRSWRSRKSRHRLGPMETQGIHWIDLIHLLFGPVEWVTGRTDNRAGTGTSPDTCSMVLGTRGGTLCSVHTSYAAPLTHYARVLSPSFILTYRDGTLSLQRRPIPPPAGTSRPAPARLLRSDPGMERLSLDALKHQLSALRGGKRGGLATCSQAMANVAVLAAFGKAVRSPGAVRMEQIPGYREWVRGFSL